MPLLGGNNGNIAVQFGFVERPDYLFGRLGNGRMGGTYPHQGSRVLLNPLQLALEFGWDVG